MWSGLLGLSSSLLCWVVVVFVSSEVLVLFVGLVWFLYQPICLTLQQQKCGFYNDDEACLGVWKWWGENAWRFWKCCCAERITSVFMCESWVLRRAFIFFCWWGVGGICDTVSRGDGCYVVSGSRRRGWAAARTRSCSLPSFLFSSLTSCHLPWSFGSCLGSLQHSQRFLTPSIHGQCCIITPELGVRFDILNYFPLLAYIPFAHALSGKHLQSCAVLFGGGERAFCLLDISDVFRFWMQVLLGIFYLSLGFEWWMWVLGFFLFWPRGWGCPHWGLFDKACGEHHECTSGVSEWEKSFGNSHCFGEKAGTCPWCPLEVFGSGLWCSLLISTWTGQANCIFCVPGTVLIHFCFISLLPCKLSHRWIFWLVTNLDVRISFGTSMMQSSGIHLHWTQKCSPTCEGDWSSKHLSVLYLGL